MSYKYRRKETLISFITMPNMYRIILLFFIFILIGNVSSGPLDEYVFHWDSTFSYKLLETYPSPAYTVYILNLTAQTWMNSI